jgi:hypothetical protein
MINVFIGYDKNEKVAFNVLSYSILKHSTRPVAITPIYLPNIKDSFIRERSGIESTDFSFSRFIVPHLMNYQGWALFLDCDQLMLGDVAELWRLRDEKYAVQVAKHDYQPQEEKKFMGAVQTKYVKKNWSSVMLMNCDKCKSLTPDYVNTATGLQLHQFKWLENDDLIGDIPLEWNWLVGHYTKGGPYFKEYKDCGFSEIWFDHFKETTTIDI